MNPSEQACVKVSETAYVYGSISGITSWDRSNCDRLDLLFLKKTML